MKKGIISHEIFERNILVVRGYTVMLDKGLEKLYGVTTGNLNKAVNRNICCFPDDLCVPTELDRVQELDISFWNIKLGRKTISAVIIYGLSLFMILG